MTPDSALSSHARLPPFWDEMVDGRGGIRPHWRPIVGMLAGLPQGGLAERARRLDRAFEEEGVVTILPADPGQGPAQRPWRCDPVPMVLSAAEFATLDAGLSQRATLLSEVLADLYGPQRLLAAGLIPPSLVFANPGFLRPCRAPTPPVRPMIHLIAADLVRTPRGEWQVLADRTGAPNGVGFARENRRMVTRVMPEAFRAVQVRQLRPFFDHWVDSLQRAAPAGAENPRLALLTPGAAHETWFEHVFLSRELGCALVEGADLTARDGQVFLKTLKGLQRVHVLLRRVEGRLVDPLELASDSALGVPGLLDAVRSGGVRVVNDPASHLAEAPALATFLPRLAEHLLGEPLRLPNVPTLWLGDPAAAAAVLAAPERWMIRHALDGMAPAQHPAEMAEAAREALMARIRAAPQRYAATEAVQPSAAPGLGARGTLDKGLAPRPLVLRLFALADGAGQWQAMPGGLARLIEDGDRLTGRLPKTGVAKDVWVLSEDRTDIVGPAAFALPPLAIRRVSGELPSRVADDLYWLGRYVERLENAARLIRAVIARLSRGWLLPRDLAELRALARCLAEAGLVEAELAAAQPDGPALPRALIELCRPNRPIARLLDNVNRLTRGVRDRLTSDMWATITHLAAEAREKSAKACEGLEELNEAAGAIIRFSAGVAGIAAENMVRGGGWLFLDLGRRIERASHTARDLGFALDQPLPRVEAGLRLAIELCDSAITYRNRYLSVLQPAPVLDLVLADPTNPRSVAYQLEAVASRLAEVQGMAEGDLARAAGGLRAEAEAMVEAVARAAEPAAEAVRLPVRLAALASQVGSLSDAIARRYFSHVQTSQAVGVGEEQAQG
ncbi:circularly permuted type 2 ATP-grasp protein [Elioraea sp.]|uniref:circularly permuted type 2 ATP-grasp protein n=1 Tax=Elioraea sp. TaxID=2185103 RepID=UPI0025BA8B4F|nr:circularly permuted type 2 ATP-grasp protein [Elioraea sp.]